MTGGAQPHPRVPAGADGPVVNFALGLAVALGFLSPRRASRREVVTR